MKKIISSLLPIFWLFSSFAQFNDSTHHYINYASTGVINNTNDNNSFVLNNTLKFNMSWKHLSVNTTNSWVYGHQQRSLTNNDYSSGLDFDLYKSVRKIYYWGIMNYVTSYSLEINDQWQTGVGLGYDAIDNKGGNFLISDGILYDRSDLDDTASTHDRYSTFRNSFRIKFRWSLKDRFVLTGSQFYQQSLSSGRDYIIISTASASVRLKKWLSVNISETFNRLNRTGRQNLLITYGLVVDKFF